MNQGRPGTSPSPLTKEQIDSYHRKGYLIVENLFSSEECDTLLGICEAHADENYSTILNLDREVFQIRSFMKDLRLVTILEALHGDGIVGVMTQIIYKKAGSLYAAQAWSPHQDNSYLQVENGTYVVSSLFLSDADPENGGLYMFPGSHQEGLLPWEPVVSYREKPGTNPGNKVRIPEKYQKVDLFIRKGSVLFFQGNIIHGSYPNLSQRSRPVLSGCYVTKGARYNLGKNAQRIPIPLR